MKEIRKILADLDADRIDERSRSRCRYRRRWKTFEENAVIKARGITKLTMMARLFLQMILD